MHGRDWQVSAVLFLGLLAGCNGKELSPQGESMLLEAASAYKSGRYDVTLTQMDAFLRDFGGTDRADEGYYLRGMARSKLKDPAGASEDLTEAMNRARHGELKGKAMIELGEIAFGSGDAVKAESMFAGALGVLPKDKTPADIGYYRLGCLLQRQGRWSDADAQLSRLLFLFDGTPLAKRASALIHCRAWTVQAGSFEDSRNADALVRTLKEKGLPAAIGSVTRDGKLLHQVHVGRHSTYDQAVVGLAEVRKHAGDALVTPTR
jgi:tetratricopeptide (TPR) repeat protein